MYGAVATGEAFSTQEVLYGGGYAQFLDQGVFDGLSHSLTHFDDPQGQADIAVGIDWVHMGQPIFSIAIP